MGQLLRRAAGSLFLLLCASLAWGAPPQLLVPHDVDKRLLLMDRPFESEGTPVRFNKQQMLSLRYLDEAEVRLPNGVAHTFIFELAEDHGGGIHSWMARHKHLGNQHRVVVTTGPHGSFGSISTPEGSFRLIPGSGFDWLMDEAAEQQHIPHAPHENDVLISPTESAKDLRQASPFAFAPKAGINSLPMTKAAPASGYVVDIMFVVTNGLSAKLGSNLLTRLHFLVARANASYADSDVAIRLRMVHHVVVNYTDAGRNGTPLAEISPSCMGPPTGFCEANFNATAFGTIESLRTTHGADVVAFLRDGSNTGGSGLAWLGERNAGSTAITNPSFMYSVTTGCVLSCESVFVHEVGHNMGLNHDRATDAWERGGRPFPPAGQYNFGYYYCSGGTLHCNPELATGTVGACTNYPPECGPPGSGSGTAANPADFSDLMAYFYSTAKNFKFSNPLLTCVGAPPAFPAQPCGLVNLADGARYLNEVRAALSAIRGTQGTYTDGSSSVTGWPPGGTMPSGFVSTGSAWTVATDRVFEGTHSLRSAQVYVPPGTPYAFPPTTFANSDLTFTGTFTAGTLSFMYQVSAYAFNNLPQGALEFSIDDVVVLVDSGENGWQFFSYPIAAGSHTLRWRFKNSLQSSCLAGLNPPAAPTCADRAWIDSLTLPLAAPLAITLTVSKAGPGTGTVTSSPAGISCGVTCTASFTAPVTLTAVATAGSAFTGWSGGGCSGTGTCVVATSGTPTVTATFQAVTGTLITRYRLYSPTTFEHLYTTDFNEYSVLPVCCAWVAEGSIYRLFNGPGTFAGVAAVPYYRLYNPFSFQHHWTTDAGEYNFLGTIGWNKEGTDGYVLPSTALGALPLYRLYLNAAGGLHLWTIDANERAYLISNAGWVDEGIAGYVVPLP